MTLSLISLMFAAALTGQAAGAAPGPAATPAAEPASARLTEAAARAGLTDLQGLTLSGYEVRGRLPRAVRASINERRPAEEAGGARHDARTRWSYAPHWQRLADGQCDPRTATVTLTLTIVLPDLATRDQLSSNEQAEWDRYFTALVRHEHNHGRIAVTGRDLMESSMRASTDCDAMRAVVQATNAEVVAASQTYDRDTDHGRREGAVYPPPRS